VKFYVHILGCLKNSYSKYFKNKLEHDLLILKYIFINNFIEDWLIFSMISLSYEKIEVIFLDKKGKFLIKKYFCELNSTG